MRSSLLFFQLMLICAAVYSPVASANFRIVFLPTSPPPPSPSPPSPPIRVAAETAGVPPMHFEDKAILALNGTALPSCVYQPIFGTCEPTNNLLLSGSVNLTGASYGARALAFVVAANAYCSQFPRNSSNCAKYPCTDNGEACAVAGPVNYGIYACPGSKAADDTYCTEVAAANISLCKANPACSYKANTTTRPATCMAKFKQNLTNDQFSQYLSDFGTTRRNVWGCCEGSEAKWMNSAYCDRFSSDQEGCSGATGCVFDDGTGSCSWSASFWIGSNFVQSKGSKQLTSISQQCAMKTSEKACNAYLAVKINATALKSLLGFDLSKINTPVNDTECVVWTAED